MNLRSANVISDLRGLTGETIVRAIVAGERDSWKLADLSHPRIQASREEIAILEDNWRTELLFVLQQEVEMYDTYQQRIAECDQQLQKLQKHLAQFTDNLLPQLSQAEGELHRENPAPKRKKPQGNAPRFHLNSELQRIAGVDLTQIDSVDVMVAKPSSVRWAWI